MFLLNNEIIFDECKKDSGILRITDFDKTCLGPSYYYFRLGRHYHRWNAETSNWIIGELTPDDQELIVGPEDYVIVQSLETFDLSRSVMAMFGPATQLFRQGFSMRNSPFIDPNFPGDEGGGYLELGLKNEISMPISIRFRSVIGKACFYNVSDTYPIGVDIPENNRHDFIRRRTGARPERYVPRYDDHPVPEYEEVEKFGRKKRGEQE